MPSAASFKQGFSIQPGDSIGKFIVDRCECLHVVVEEFERYEFPIKIFVRCDGKAKTSSVLTAVRKLAKDPRVIYSEYGSPYECHLGKPTVTAGDDSPDSSADGNTSTFVITTKGSAVRRRDLPTLAQQRLERVRSTGQHETSLADARRSLPGYRLLKSRFATSKCALCGEIMEPGETIAKRSSDAVRGGWGHVRCALERAQHGAGKDTARETKTGDAPAADAQTRTDTQQQDARNVDDDVGDGTRKRGRARAQSDVAADGDHKRTQTRRVGSKGTKQAA